MRGERGALKVSLALALGILLALPMVQSLARPVARDLGVTIESDVAFADDPINEGGQDPAEGMQELPYGRLPAGSGEPSSAVPDLWYVMVALMTWLWR